MLQMEYNGNLMISIWNHTKSLGNHSPAREGWGRSGGRAGSDWAAPAPSGVTLTEHGRGLWWPELLAAASRFSARGRVLCAQVPITQHVRVILYSYSVLHIMCMCAYYVHVRTYYVHVCSICSVTRVVCTCVHKLCACVHHMTHHYFTLY